MTEVEDLKAQLESAYAAIHELDEDLAAGRLSASDHADLKARSERQAAGLLGRVREAERTRGPGPPRVAARASTAGARLRSPLALACGAGLLLVLGLSMGLLLARATSDERAAAAPPAAAAGGAVRARVVSPQLEMLSKAVEAEAAPSTALLAFAHLALDEGQIPAAIWAYKRVLAREPRNVEALTHMGLILAQGKHLDEALARIEEAIGIAPTYAHAHWDRANLLFSGKKDYAAAQKALEAFLALMPTGDDAERARAMLAEARRQAGVRAGQGASSLIPSAPKPPGADGRRG